MNASCFAKALGKAAAVLALAVLCAPEAHAQAEADTSGTQQVEIVAPSDSLVQATNPEGQRVRRLIGNVRLRQGTTRLRADRATQRLGAGEIIFTGDVLIVDEGDSLWADRVRYDSRRKVGRATGEVRVSSDGEVLLAGPVGRYFFEEERALFPRRVTLVDSARVLKSRGGEYFSRTERAEFYRQVHVFSDSTYLEADSVTYRRQSEVTNARGNVFVERRGDRADSEEEGDVGAQHAAPTDPNDPTRRDTARSDTLAMREQRPSLLGRPLPVDTTRRALLPDTTARTLLWGKRAYNDPRDGYSRVTGRALLVRLQPPDSSETDSAAAAGTRPDTLIVRARQLETARSDTLRRLTATDSVRLWQKDLQAVADSSVYDQRPEGRGNAPTGPDSLASADSLARPDSLSSADSAVGGRPPPQRESRFFGSPLAWSAGSGEGGRAQLSGDSLRVTGRGGSVRRLFARGSAFLAQADSALAGRHQQLKGRRLVGRFAEDADGQATLRRLRAGPNARAIYFQKKDSGGTGSADSSSALSGAVRVSSDSIVFRLRGGELKKMRVLGGVEGTRHRAENVPDPFRLDGFVWVPERRPRKDAFLTEERVRRRLVRPDAPQEEPPPAAPPPATAASSDAPGDQGDG